MHYLHFIDPLLSIHFVFIFQLHDDNEEEVEIKFYFSNFIFGFTGKQSEQFLRYTEKLSFAFLPFFICNICNRCLSKVQWQSFSNNTKLSNF